MIRICCTLAVSLGLLGSITAAASASASDLVEDVDAYAAWDADHCTAIGVGRGATADGSTMTTHNNDCAECDIRVTHVAARDWPEGAKRPIFAERNAYPKYAEEPAYNIHGSAYLLKNVDTTIYPWVAVPPIAYIPQVPHTFAYTLGSYAIQNEKQLSMGESTCRVVFWAKPVYAGGNATMNLRMIMEIAMERCDNARCAIILMGDLAVKYGFYGAAAPTDSPINQQNEAGEALTVADTAETWVFHVMPDDTGTSAIWVAQRVPEDHITVIANQFTITTPNLTDTDNFMGSVNMYDIAERNHLWSRETGEPFNFAKIYTANRPGYGPLITRRVWRVFTLAAPSLQLSPYTDTFGSYGYGPGGAQPYPFSVKPDKLLTVMDIIRMNRDQYEGTQFDLTTGTDAGPFGDPMRYPSMSAVRDPVLGLTPQEVFGGLGFPRGISLWRTAYSTVTQSRGNLPDEIGALTWIAPYAPHYSSFMPIYASANATPSAIAEGTQYKMNNTVNFWIHCLTSNYLSKWYSWTIGDTQALQASLETQIFNQQQQVEASAVNILSPVLNTLNAINNGDATVKNADKKTALKAREKALEKLYIYQQEMGNHINQQWWQYFWNMIVKYRDIYKITNPSVDNFAQAATIIAYPRWWMELVGYWGAPGTPAPGKTSQPVFPINVPDLDSQEQYSTAYPDGIDAAYPLMKNPAAMHTTQPPDSTKQTGVFFSGILFLLIGAAIGSVVTYFVFKNNIGNNYVAIPGNDNL